MRPTPAGAMDPWWVHVDGDIEVMMTPGHSTAYQQWLRVRNLHLFKIPETEIYAVGVRYLEGDGEVQ